MVRWLCSSNDMKYRNQAGQLLIELLVAMAVSAILLPAIATGFVASREGKSQQRQRLDAVSLLKEAEEAVRIVREAGWAGIATNGTYHPVIAGGTWTLSVGSEVTNGFTRSVVIRDVQRNGSGDIVVSGGSTDPSTKKIDMTVSWGTFGLSTVSSTQYLTRYLGNRTWVQTTQADFDAGGKNGVITTDTSGGEVTLGAGGKGDWCAPNLTIAAVDLPKQGVANAVSAIPGRVFAGTGDNASGVSYATANISDTDPPVGSILGTYDGFKTNGIFGEQSYAYLATDNNAKEIEIVSLTTPYTEAGYFNAPGNGNGNSIAVAGNIGYMTSGSTFHTFDLTSRAGSRTGVGSVTLDGTGVKIVVVGSYAYVAINAATTQLNIVDVSNPASPSVVARANLNAGAGRDVVVNSTGTRAYVATAFAAEKPEFWIINTITKSGTVPVIGSYTTDGMSPKAVTVVPGNRAIVVGTGGAQQYVVLDITDETYPMHCTSHSRSGGLAIATGVNGIASVIEGDGDTYSYIITGDSSAELKIIQGGPGGLFTPNGTFESSTLMIPQGAAFNRFIVNGIFPIGTTITYQVAGAAAANNSCNGVPFTYVGPDGTGNTKFETGSAIPLSAGPGYMNPAQCFRYKVFLATSDTFSQPIFTDITVNYSP